MTTTQIRKVVATALTTAAAIGATVAALTVSTGAQIGGVVAETPPTSTPPLCPHGNGWGHG